MRTPRAIKLWAKMNMQDLEGDELVERFLDALLAGFPKADVRFRTHGDAC